MIEKAFLDLLPTNEQIVRWSNEVAELTDDQKEYTATGSRIAIQERCAGARWMLSKIKELSYKPK